jgi:hypothetical protein
VPFLKYGSRSNALKAGAPRGSSVWANIVIAPQLMSRCGWGRQPGKSSMWVWPLFLESHSEELWHRMSHRIDYQIPSFARPGQAAPPRSRSSRS